MINWQEIWEKKGNLDTDSKKGIFLGYKEGTTKNVIWYDVATNQVKHACHFSCDEMYNDLPLSNCPPNVIQLERTQNGD